MRFFAGLYFTYRVVILIGWFAPSHLTQSYLLLELIFVTILAIHAIAQPYNNRRHNILDTLIFLNLAVVNGITLYNYHYAKHYDYYRYGIGAFIHIQLFLVYLPLACFITYAALCLISKAKGCYKSKTKALNIQLKELMHSGSDDELPSRLEENSDHEQIFESANEVDYELFGKQTDTY